MATSLKRSQACTATLSAPNPAAGHHRPTPLLETPGHSQASLGQSLVGSLLLSPGSWCTRFCCALQESISQSCASSGGVNGDLFQEDLCHTHTQSPCPCGRQLPTGTSTGDAQTQFCVSLCGAPGFWCTQGLFEHLWQIWGLILKVNSLLLPSCWGFSFALGRGVSPHSHSSAYRFTGVFLTLDVGYLYMASPEKHSHRS